METNEKKPYPPEWIGCMKPCMVQHSYIWRPATIGFISRHRFYTSEYEGKSMIAPIDYNYLGKEIDYNNMPPGCINHSELIEKYEVGRLPGYYYNPKI